MRTERAGVVLPEVVVAGACGLLVVQLALVALVAARRAEADLRVRSERLAATRVARMALRRELRSGVPGRDWVAFPPDSMRVRAFRGRALVCPAAVGATSLVVSFDGSRRPDPTKDSLLVLDEGGAWSAAQLVSVSATAAACPAAPTAPVEAWEIAPPPPHPAVLVRLFEPASYHLATGALRYRVGGGGREPLTAEVLDTRASRFNADSGGVSIRLESSGARSWSWRAFLGRAR